MPQAGLQVRPAYSVYRLIWSGLDILFPPVCGGCGKRGYRWCPECARSLRLLSENICSTCGEPVEHARICQRCQQKNPAYSALRSYAEFGGPLREALHHLKYKHDIGLGEALSEMLIELYARLAWRIDLIVPVPLSQGRLKERGYNQAALLARPLALAINARYASSALARTRNTPSQVGLSVEERQENVSGAFTADRKQVWARDILLVDDTVTTGSTVNACAEALLAAGSGKVYALSLARAVLKAKNENDRQPNRVSIGPRSV